MKKKLVLLPILLFLVSCATLVVPHDFLTTDDGSWAEWLAATIDVEIKDMPLHLLPATKEFQGADLSVKIPGAPSIRITVRAKQVSRRQALWRITEKYGLKMKFSTSEGSPQCIELTQD